MKKSIPQKKINKSLKDLPKINYPANKSIYFYLTLIFSFLINYLIYLLTLAPTVTFEDSGELIAAAYNLGIPHEPGYPLFSIIGKLFSLIPVGNVAYRLNLMSAFFSSLAAVFICYSTIIIIEDTFINTKLWQNIGQKQISFIKYCVALSSGIFFGTSYEIWEQSIITEVYGLNNFFIALFILLTLIWNRQKTKESKLKYLFLISFIIGLTLTNHPSSLLIIPVFFIYIIVSDRTILLNFKTILKSVFYFFIGLLPFIYLPVASSFNPKMDWGNPENATNFIRTITRHQYQSQDKITLNGFISQLVYSFKLLSEQWYPVFLIFAILGIYLIYKYNKNFFWFCFVYLFFSIPVMVYMTNTDIKNPISAEINKNTLSVAFIPAYLLISAVIGIGLFYLINIIRTKKTIIYSLFALLSVLFAASNIYKNYRKEDKSTYYFPESYANNIFNTLPKNSLLFINWDPFGFPLNYYQFVENKRPDIIVIDQLLLKRSWYIQWLKDHYQNFTEKSDKEINSFLQAVEPFENDETFDGNYIQYNYINMINSFIDNKLKQKNKVFFTYYPEKSIMRNYYLEPLFSAYKYTDGNNYDTTISDSDVNVKIFLNSKLNNDVMSLAMKEYYGNIYASRAVLMKNFGNKYQSVELNKKGEQLLNKVP